MVKIITLYKNYKYDNQYDYIKTFTDKASQNSYFNSLSKIVIDEHNYVKDNQAFKVLYNYEYLLLQGVNYLSFTNGSKTIYAFITRKEYLNEDVTLINYEIDVIQTFLFDFTINKSFVERKKCTIDEIADFDEGIEIGEHIIASDTKVIDKTGTFFAMFNGFKDYYINESKTDFKEMPITNSAESPVTKIDGITYPLLFVALEDEFIMGVFNKHLINFPNLVGVVRIPNCTYTKTNLAVPYIHIANNTIVKDNIGLSYVVSNITSVPVSGGGITVPKTSVTDFYPYTYYILTDGETEPLIMQAQYTNGSITINGKFALSHQSVERYYPTYYKGSTDGTIYNITNNSIMMLPSGYNGGMETLMNNLYQMEYTDKSVKANTMLSSAMAGTSLASGDFTGTAISLQGSIDRVMDNIARKKDIATTPSSIKSFGTPSTRNAFGTNKVRVVKYTIQDKYKTRVNNFIERYGNKYNNFATIDIKSYKGYIKFSEVDIDTTIDNMFTNQIINILQRGVYIE